jgi:hypothetical protein
MDQPIVGWRRWNLVDGAEAAPVLAPAGSGVDTWPHKRAAEARCGAPRLLRRGFRPHPSPDFSCTCGIYVSNELDVGERSTPAYPPPPVVGTASVWGRVIEHERGFRAEFAYPARLRLVCALCVEFEPGPGEPSVTHAFLGSLFPLCREHSGGIQLYDGRRTQLTDVDPSELQARLLDAYAVDLLPFEVVAPLFGRPAPPRPPPYWPAIRAIG